MPGAEHSVEDALDLCGTQCGCIEAEVRDAAQRAADAVAGTQGNIISLQHQEIKKFTIMKYHYLFKSHFKKTYSLSVERSSQKAKPWPLKPCISSGLLAFFCTR